MATAAEELEPGARTERKSILKRLNSFVRKPMSQRAPVVSFRMPHEAAAARPAGAAVPRVEGMACPGGGPGGGPDGSPVEITPRSVSSGPGGYVLFGSCMTPRSSLGNTGSTCSSPFCGDFSPALSDPSCPGLSPGLGSLNGLGVADAEGRPRPREVFMLYASPLFHGTIDVRAESEALSQVLNESGSDVRLKMGVATAGSLTKILALARSRQGLVLHLSAHAVKHPQKGVGLVLEDPFGGPHVLWRDKLEEFLAASGGLRHISMLFLSACYSEELAQIFIEHGCHHVLATRAKVRDSTARRFSQHFYYELGVNTNLLKAWEGSVQALRIDPDEHMAGEADFFTFYGQRGSESATLDSLCGMNAGSAASIGSGLSVRDFPNAATFLDMQLPAQTTICVGREAHFIRLSRSFYGPKKRAVLYHGPRGIGKSRFATEYARFATAPGRLFSCSPLLLKITTPDLLTTVLALEEQLDALCANLALGPSRLSRGGVTRGAGSGDISVASSYGTWSRSEASSGYSDGMSDTADSDGVSLQARIRSRIFQTIRNLERSHRSAQLLIVIDDEVGYLNSSADARWLLGDLLEHTHHLHVLIASREPVYESLGSTHIVNEPLPPLSDLDAARLFMLRINRRLEPAELGYRCSGHFGHLAEHSLDPTREQVAAQLRGHPLLQRLGGHPGRLIAAASRVVPGGPGLCTLAQQEDLLDDAESPRQTPLVRRNTTSERHQSEGLADDRPARPYSAHAVLERDEPAEDPIDLR